MSKPRITLKGVVFDMDGTLTLPNLDFAEMYRRAGVDKNDDILDALTSMDSVAASRAKAVIEEMEEEGRLTLQLMPGVAETVHWLHAQNIPRALVTRNSAKTVQRLEELLDAANVPGFDLIISRDDDYPHKPDPTSFYSIARKWNVPTDSLVMVGDSPNNDISYGKAAGAHTVLLDTGSKQIEDNNIQADIYISDMASLPRELWKKFAIESRPV